MADFFIATLKFFPGIAVIFMMYLVVAL